MNKNTKKHICLIILLALFVNAILFVIDYFSVFSLIGFNVNSINLDFLSLFLGNTVVVSLFLITYFIVDSRGIQKEENQLMTAYITLIGIYERCKDMVDIFSQNDLRERAVKKCNSDKTVNEDKAHMHFLNFPFENEMIIYDFVFLKRYLNNS